MKFSSVFFVLAVAASGLATTVQTVKDDITKVGGQVDTLNKAIDAFANPGGTLSQGLVSLSLCFWSDISKPL
jgi:hypothetical protein